MLMPSLTNGVTYRWTDKELIDAIASDDHNDFTNSQCHPKPWQREKEIVLEYTELDIENLRDQLEELRPLYYRHEDHRERVGCIKRKLEGGERAFPVFIGKNDPTKKIQIGVHRAIPFLELSSPVLPVLLFKYDQ